MLELTNRKGWEQAPLPRTGGVPARAEGSLAHDRYDSHMSLRRTSAGSLIAIACAIRVLGQAPPPPATPPAITQLTGKTIRVYEAAEAIQGVAAGIAHFFVIDNATLAKYEIRSGQLVDRWIGAPNGPIRHMNSCLVDAGRIWCCLLYTSDAADE